MSSVAISFLVYTLAVGALGLLSARFSKASHSDFLLADRGLGPWVAGLSAAASAESGWVTLGLVGTAFNTGVAAFWVVPGTVAAFVFNWLILGPRLRKESKESDSLTMVDVVASRYSFGWATAIRLIGFAIVISMLTAYVAAQLNAAGKTFQGTFEWEYGAGVLIGAGIVLVYTLLGGFRAVSWTDVVQAIFMILAVTYLPALLIYQIGGLAEFWQQLKALDGGEKLVDGFAGNAGYALIGFLATWLGIPIGNSGQPHAMIRLMAARDEQAIRRGGIICSLWVLVLFTGAITLGIAARVYYSAQNLDHAIFADAEHTIPIIATDTQLVPGVLGGLLLAAILAAICSTADSQLLVSASALSHDVLEKICGYRPSLLARKVVERCALLLVAAVAIAIALSEVREVFSFVLDYGWAGLGAGLGPALILKLLWKRTTGAGLVAGMLAGIATVFIWKQFETLSKFHVLIPAFLIAWFVIVGTSLLLPDVGRTEAKDSSS